MLRNLVKVSDMSNSAVKWDFAFAQSHELSCFFFVTSANFKVGLPGLSEPQ